MPIRKVVQIEAVIRHVRKADRPRKERSNQYREHVSIAV